MTIKELLSPLTRGLKFIFKLIIPFYSFTKSSKYLQLIKGDTIDRDKDRDQEFYLDLSYQYRRFDHYKKSDVNNIMRGLVRTAVQVFVLTAIIAGLYFLPVFPLIASLTLIIGFKPAIIYASIGIIGFVSCGIISNLADKFIKEAIRFVSRCLYPDAINPSYPWKWNPYTHPSLPPRQQGTLAELNETEKTNMKKLYDAKQKIKQNPKGWWGLSWEQKEQCKAINFVVKKFRITGSNEPIRDSMFDYTIPKEKEFIQSVLSPK